AVLCLELWAAKNNRNLGNVLSSEGSYLILCQLHTKKVIGKKDLGLHFTNTTTPRKQDILPFCLAPTLEIEYGTKKLLSLLLLFF
ncbi:MAG: hypothetical protein AAGK05_18995, partial [Pseudomonadota bacterium]